MARTSWVQRLIDLKMVYKLAGGFGLILLLFLCVLLLSTMSTQRSIRSFKDLIGTDLTMAKRAERTDLLLTNSRKSQKDFLLTRDKAFEKEYDGFVSELRNELAAMNRIALDKKDSQSVASIQVISKNIEVYQSTFHELVGSMEKIGLDHNSGLQGAFRDVIHALEKDIHTHDISELYMAFLIMWGNQKDYFSLHAQSTRAAIEKGLQSIRDGLQSSTIDQDSKALTLKGLNEYEDAFRRYVNSDPAGQIAIEPDIRKAAGLMDQGMKEVHVPGAEALLLMIRRHEKDYLLRFDTKYVVKNHDALDALAQVFDKAPILQRHKDDVAAKINEYGRNFDALVSEYGVLKTQQDHLEDITKHIEPLVFQLKKTAEASAQARITSTEKRAFATMGIVFMVAVSALVIGLVFAVFMTRSITKALKQAVLFAHDISNGDLTGHMDVHGKDELGNLSRL